MRKLIHVAALVVAAAVAAPAAPQSRVVDSPFIQNLTGAAARTFLDKGREVQVSVTDFKNSSGARVACNGVQDDKTGIQAALDSGATAIYIPPGNCIVSGGLTSTWSGKNLRIYGAGGGVSSGGSQGSVITLTGSGALLTYNGSGTPTSFTIENLKLRTTNAAAQTFGLKLNQSFVNHVRHVGFEGFSYVSGATVSAGLYLTGAGTNSVVTDVDGLCTFESNYIGIYSDLSDLNVLNVVGNWFHGTTGYAIRGGDFAAGSFAFVTWTVRQNTFESTTAGTADVYIVGGGRNYVHDGNYHEWSGNRNALVINGGVSYPVSQAVRFTNNSLNGPLAAGDGFVQINSTVEDFTASSNWDAVGLGASKYLVKSTSGVPNNVRILRPSAPSGQTPVSAYYDSATVYTSEKNSAYDVTSFTPVMQGGSVAGTTTYTTQIGRYSRVGNVLHYYIELVWTNATGTGALTVGFFPFAARASTQPVATVWADNITYTANAHIVFRVFAGNNFGYLWANTNGAAATQVLIDTAGSLIISGSFIIDDQ